MKSKIGFLVLGFFLAYIFLFALVAGFLFLDVGDRRPPFRDQLLASGKTAKITLFALVWGVEHDERNTNDDLFALEYVSSAADTADAAAMDRQTSEAFELIRPVSEQWGFRKATISVFPTTERKGKYHIYTFTRAPEGNWTFERHSAKVFVND